MNPHPPGQGRLVLSYLALFAAAAALSAKTAVDLVARAASFPSWFVPCFVAGLAALVAWAGAAAAGVWRRRGAFDPASGRLATVIWFLLPLSFVGTAAVHQFYPFRPSLPAAWLAVGPVLRFNFALAGLGFLVATALALVYRAGRRQAALLGLAALGVLLLVPNDDCANPFNEWWLGTVGASPLMFVPNLYAILFAFAALLGVRPRLNAAALAATCAGVTLLGLGHMTRVIW